MEFFFRMPTPPRVVERDRRQGARHDVDGEHDPQCVDKRAGRPASALSLRTRFPGRLHAQSLRQHAATASGLHDRRSLRRIRADRRRRADANRQGAVQRYGQRKYDLSGDCRSRHRRTQSGLSQVQRHSRHHAYRGTSAYQIRTTIASSAMSVFAKTNRPTTLPR